MRQTKGGLWNYLDSGSMMQFVDVEVGFKED
jgi:hypothetical protein